MAHELCRTDHVPLRRFLQTYHLTVIREGSIAFPFIVCMARDGKLDSTLMDHAACGLALMELGDARGHHAGRRARILQLRFPSTSIRNRRAYRCLSFNNPGMG